MVLLLIAMLLICCTKEGSIVEVYDYSDSNNETKITKRNTKSLSAPLQKIVVNANSFSKWYIESENELKQSELFSFIDGKKVVNEQLWKEYLEDISGNELISNKKIQQLTESFNQFIKNQNQPHYDDTELKEFIKWGDILFANNLDDKSPKKEMLEYLEVQSIYIYEDHISVNFNFDAINLDFIEELGEWKIN